jgi:phosphorylase kinase gamma subunit
VRRCIEKETGIEYAAKIIDLSNDSHDAGVEGGKTMLESTIEEVHILRMVAGHPYISEDYIFVVHFVIIFMVVECMPKVWF